MTTREPARPGKHHLLLFLAGTHPVSAAIRSGVADLCANRLQDCELTVIDILDDYQVAVQHGIFATPCLLLLETNRRVVGDLTNADAVLRTLGLPGG